ncbi:MAG TPA: S9 family peptidase [Chloroflexota bacterium]|nr:S9 family peptidase [Chloroflexota bacterium]
MADSSPRTTIPFERFLNVRRCYGPSFAPDGKRLAFIADLSGVPEAWSLPTEGGWPEQLTFVGDRVGLAAFSPADDQLVVATDRGGDENVQLWRLSARGETLTRLTLDETSMYPFGGWSPDGRFVAYTSNERNRAYLDVIVQEVTTGAPRTVLTTEGMHTVDGWSSDGQRLLVRRVESSSLDVLFEVAVADGSVHPISPLGEARYQHPTYRPDGQAVYTLTDNGRDFLSLVEIELATGATQMLVEANWDVELFALSPDGRSIAYALNEDGYSRLAILDLATRKSRRIDLPPGVIARGFVGNWGDGLAWSPDSRRLAFSLTGPRTTQNLWLADATTGAARELTFATAGAIPTDAMAEPELVHFPTFDDRRVPAYLFRPAGARLDGTARAVVSIHGGPESQARPAFDPIVQYLVNRGYVVLIPNVRGSTGYGNRYSHLDDVEKRLDAVADARAAAEWLGTTGHAHPRKIAAMGGSYGGFMVLSSLCTYPETWAAGVDLYGVANFITLLENTHPFRRKHRSAEYGSPEQHRELLGNLSPTNHLERIVAPLFVVHGENDIRVPIGESEQVVSSLRERGIPVEFLRLPRAGHGIVSLEDKLAVYPAIVRFLDRYLEGS